MGRVLSRSITVCVMVGGIGSSGGICICNLAMTIVRDMAPSPSTVNCETRFSPSFQSAASPAVAPNSVYLTAYHSVSLSQQAVMLR